MLKNMREKSRNLVSSKGNQRNIRKMCIVASPINRFPNMLSKALKEKHIFMMEVIIVVCSICSGLISDQGKQGSSQGISGETTSLIQQTPWIVR